MGSNGCGDDSSEGLSITIDKESCSEREISSDAVVETDQVDKCASPLNEFHGHETLTLNELRSPASGPENLIAEEEDDDLPEYDWEEHANHQLEGHLTNNLLAIFQSAIQIVVQSGYSDLAAGWAVLNSGLSRGGKDVVSNIVDGALALLKTTKESDIPKKPVFDGLRSLVEYFVLEMTNVIIEAKPKLTISEAMRCLLKSDMNLTRACGEEDGGPGEKIEASSTSHSSDKNPGKEPTADSTSSCPIPSPPLNPPKGATYPGKRWKKGNISVKEMRDQLCLARDHIRASAQAGVMNDQRSGGPVGKKTKSRKDKSRHKAILHLEIKDRKDHASEEANKVKLAAWGNMVLEKSLKSQSNLLTRIADANSTSIPDSVPSPASPVKETVSASSEEKFKAPQDPRLKAKSTHVSEPLKDTDYYAGIPYDETLQKHIPQDEKDENILLLTPRKQELEKKLQYWSDWAREKVMQATKRLTQDQGELKKLRQEKVEEEKCNKEKQIMEDNANKRICEMETALSKATDQIEVANSYFRRLQEENSLLRKRMGVSNRRATQSFQYLEEAIEREQDAIRKCQSLDTQKGLCLDELASAKNEVAELNNRLEKMKERQDRFQVLLRQEESDKLKAIADYESLRSKREQDEALAAAEAENITQMAEVNIQKTKEDIKNLEKMISELKLESERSKIASLNIGYGSCSSSSDDFFTFRSLQVPEFTKSFPVLQKFGSKRARECIMCMTEEISVVFLPCVHQVLCVECNIRHEKQGMKDCPSCRTTIAKRIPVKYRPV
ncbi:putative E3 ubiquitin-protein ligase RF298 [Primulina eburnea]|uniref:putative E3 ubiquitin-protein ligase RF298 n=1 Tax=Primulina eburnea TaxID=1245227 RepID=UPI003C6C077B